jgi:hypothetical protein
MLRPKCPFFNDPRLNIVHAVMAELDVGELVDTSQNYYGLVIKVLSRNATEKSQIFLLLIKIHLSSIIFVTAILVPLFRHLP